MNITPTLPATMPPRGSASFNSETRGDCRKWLTARGASYSQIKNLPLAELERIYNDTTDAALRALLASVPDVAVNVPLAAALGHIPAPQTPQEKHAPKPAPVTQDASKAGAIAALLDLLAAKPAEAPPLDEARIIELVKEHAPKAEPREWKITIGEKPAVTIGRQHYKFALLLATIAARVPAYLVGPAGTGKTSSAEAVAAALGLPYSAVSVGPMTSKGDLFGMRDAHGKYHESDLVRTARDGGVFLFDEFDAGNPATLTAVNMLLANGQFATPAGMVTKSAEFVPVFALNTYGTGASREYVGRNQLDAATLDRGAFIDWPLDEGLEASFVGVSSASPVCEIDEGGVPSPAEWLATVQRTRRAVAAAGLRHIISPRATLYGAAMAAAGIGRKHLSDALLVKGLDAVAAGKIINY